jgi:hypothetical protein
VLDVHRKVQHAQRAINRSDDRPGDQRDHPIAPAITSSGRRGVSKHEFTAGVAAQAQLEGRFVGAVATRVTSGPTLDHMEAYIARPRGVGSAGRLPGDVVAYVHVKDLNEVDRARDDATRHHPPNRPTGRVGWSPRPSQTKPMP